jgi:hypothetical protein
MASPGQVKDRATETREAQERGAKGHSVKRSIKSVKKKKKKRVEGEGLDEDGDAASTFFLRSCRVSFGCISYLSVPSLDTRRTVCTQKKE